MSDDKLNKSKANNIAFVFVCSGVCAVLGLVAYVRDWLRTLCEKILNLSGALIQKD